MNRYVERLSYFRWWIFRRLRVIDAALIIFLIVSLTAAAYFFWAEREMWHSYEHGRTDFVDTKFVANEWIFDAAFAKSQDDCVSAPGSRCPPWNIAEINLTVDESTGNLFAAVVVSGTNTFGTADGHPVELSIGFGDTRAQSPESKTSKTEIFLEGFDVAEPTTHAGRLFPTIVRDGKETPKLGWEGKRVLVANGVSPWWYRPFGFYEVKGRFLLFSQSDNDVSTYGRPNVVRDYVRVRPLLVQAPAGYVLSRTKCENSSEVVCFYLHRSYGAMAFAVFLMALSFVPVMVASRQTPGSLRPIDLLSTLVVYGAIRVTIVGGVNPQLLAPAFIDIVFGALLVWLAFIYLRR